jgi:predicted CoA-binding protein
MQPNAGKTVAIVGASADPSKYSNKSVRAHLAEGWTVYPVNPKGGTIEGCKAYERLEDVPAPVQRISLYLPPTVGVKVLPAVAVLAPAEFFVNPGAESEDFMAEAKRLGLAPLYACSIVDIGRSPAEFADG